MLLDLNIQNFTIAEDLSLEFKAGMTVLTGETGAGKSLLVDALGLVLGDRADASTVRNGCDRAQISAMFDLSTRDDVQNWLAEQDLNDAQSECHLRRIIQATGRSKAFINGQSVALATLKNLGSRLMDIHGQHEHQSLTRPRAQRVLLDRYAGLDKPLSAVHEAYDAWYRLDQTYRTLSDANAQRNERLDLLRFQVQELNDLNLTADEYKTLADDQRRISHLAGLAEGVRVASDALGESDDSVQARLGSARRALAPLLSVDAQLEEVSQMLDEAQIQIDEADVFLRRYGADLNMDPAEHQRVEQRLDLLTDVARKHRIAPGQLHDKLTELNDKLDDLDNADDRLKGLAVELADAEQSYRRCAAALTRKRKTAARKLSGAVGKVIASLGMPDAVFSVDVDPRDAPGFGRDGDDQVSFQIAANPGQPAGPLAKVASGGELSRVSLAISVVTAKTGERRCMVFDEVDAGIGGAVAQVVGDQLRRLSDDAQVLCVTHHAQVASQAHQHWQVSKAASDGTTRSQVVDLAEKARIEELARMLGGAKITKRSRDHAAEMRTLAKKTG
ncbi:MAG: DNA repair protein RecN [Gammaproteobacteria bacterium]